MKRLVVVMEESIGTDMIKSCEGKGVYNDEGIVMTTFNDLRNKANIDFTSEDEVLAACETEEGAKDIASYMSKKLTAKQFEDIICLEGYEGKHYFKNCIRVPKELVLQSLTDLVDMLFEPAMVTLDYYDLQQVVQGTENRIAYFQGKSDADKDELKNFLVGKNVKRCMVNIMGNIDMLKASELMAEITQIDPEAPIGVMPLDFGGDTVSVMVIYRDMAV